MIILKHLTIERFRLLREINIHFPQRGSILIQGPNEAGKSSLLESIYFALYGTPINSDHGRRTIDDLVQYGAGSASATLTLSIGATELTINRTIERGKGQHVTLNVRRLGMPDGDPITHLDTANEYIIAELGHMDGETLRNSCFIEQNGLNRLEHLPGSEREATIRKLLGLEKLMRLTEQFKLTPNDEQMLIDCTERLKLAEIQARIPELSRQLGQTEAALDAVTVSEDLAEIGQQEADIAEQELSLEQLRTKRSELKARQVRIQQMRKADTTLAEIIAAYDAMGEARRELPELDRQIAELDRREQEELPPLEKRVNELVDLARSFGTLERMSNDLLTSVSTIKELEQELKHSQELQRDSDELDEQIIHAHLRVDQARQSLNELEERKRAGRPQLEARLQRLRGLSERLEALHKAEEAYTRRAMQQGLIEENTVLLTKVRKDLKEAEQRLALVEAQARQDQQQAEVVEKHWRELSIHRQLEEWIRLKGQSLPREELAQAEQHVMAAHQRQEQLTVAALGARRAANSWLISAIGCIAGAFLVGALAVALFMASHSVIGASLAGFLVLLLFAGAAYSYYNYNNVHNEEQIASQQMQDAISQVGMMVAAREAAMRSVGAPLAGAQGMGALAPSHNALAHIENEIRSLGGTVPRSREEAIHLQHLLQQPRDQNVAAPLAGAQGAGSSGADTFADVQQRLTWFRDAAMASRNQVNVAMEALAALRKERQRLEDQRKNEDWNNIDAKLRSDRIAIEDRQHEIATLAGQEGLPIPSFDASIAQNLMTGGEFASGELSTTAAIVDAIKATEREISSLDSKLDLVSALATQVKIHQEALDILLERKRLIQERAGAQYTTPITEQIERAREQQAALRSALQHLQDSLRQRVKPLGVSFGQAAVSSAETAARKQLEALHFALGSRVELQSRRATYLALLKDRQDSLADHYQQLAKFSGSLGSWIIPPNPFAEALAALRQRCHQEIEEANESKLLQELEKLRIQENASNAKIALCQQEIEETHERIAAMLVQRVGARLIAPQSIAPSSYSFTDIVAVWPLVGEYTSQDRDSLEEQRDMLEKELQEREQQELTLSMQLRTGGIKLDLDQARQRMEQQDRSYQTKKRGNLLIKSVNDRLVRKMLPRTEYYMQQILPLLTSRRYHDVRLTTDQIGEGGTLGAQTASVGPFQVSVWDTAAAEYVHKSALSGGAADQLSLALRLAFAVAVLPRELGAAPGFVLLDEPLNSSDRGRTQSLVDVVTGEILGQHFEQVLFVSHSSAFDPALFPYHVYLENGAIVESNLPIVPSFQAIAGEANSTNRHGDQSDAALEEVPASPVPAAFGE